MNLENCLNESLGYQEAIKSSFVPGYTSDWPEGQAVEETPEEPVEPASEPVEEPVEEPEVPTVDETPEEPVEE